MHDRSSIERFYTHSEHNANILNLCPEESAIFCDDRIYAETILLTSLSNTNRCIGSEGEGMKSNFT